MLKQYSDMFNFFKRQRKKMINYIKNSECNHKLFDLFHFFIVLLFLLDFLQLKVGDRFFSITLIFFLDFLQSKAGQIVVRHAWMVLQFYFFSLPMS